MKQPGRGCQQQAGQALKFDAQHPRKQVVKAFLSFDIS
jgi:hypothetical protein